jgi:hypothetical protein
MKNTKKREGRPPKPIDWKTFEELCALQCTQSEMAAVLKINVDTLCDRSREHYGTSYSEIYKRFSEAGLQSLRRNQFVLSRTNASMAIWLGKIWLKQKDNSSDSLKEVAGECIIAAVKEINRNAGVSRSGQSSMEAEQPLLDQKQDGPQG